MDDSTSRSIQEALGAAMKREWPDLHEPVDFWLFMENRPIITPSWDLQPDEAWIVPSSGGIHSGLKMTAEQGTLIATICALYALEACGLDINEWPQQTEFTLAIQGDDVHLETDKPVNLDAWRAAWLELGYDCELAPDTRFLSRHRVAGSSFPVAGRIVQQTMSNEHEPQGPEALGLAYLGFFARSEGVEQLPVTLQTEAWNVISTAAWVQATGQPSLETLRHWCGNAPQARTEIARALQSVAGQAWLAAAERDAEHSAASAAQVAFAASMGMTTSRTASLDATIEQVIVTARSLPPHDLMSEAVAGYQACSTSNVAGWSWLARLAKRLHLTADPIETQFQEAT
jgi:hypothetical protein